MMITVFGIQQEIPVGVELLQDDLYNTNFDALSIGDTADTDLYTFYNPRRDSGKGFTPEEMQELYLDIQEEGLVFPFVCIWVVTDGVVSVAVIDGERRHRCIRKLIEKNERCWSRLHKKWMPASEVYNKIPCRIFSANDKEALKIAFMLSDRAVAWGDGATAKLVKRLRKCNADDEEILALTKKTGQWLRDMDKICTLDDLTFDYLAEDKINRTVALMLSETSDLEKRHRYLYATYDDAVEHHQEYKARAEIALVKAEAKEEIAEAFVAESEITGSNVVEAAENLEKAKENTKEKEVEVKQARKPRGKIANLKRGAEKVDGEEVSDLPKMALRPGKIKKQLETIKELIKNGGKDNEGKETLPIMTLHTLVACYEAILSGKEDIMKVIHRQVGVRHLLQAKQPDIIVEEKDPEVEEQN